MKTARFHEVVARTGRPTLHLLWAPVAEDSALKRAEASHRVMTVHQHPRGAKKDFGEVGLVAAPKAQFLIFPKSLQAFAGRRIVGIDYDLLEQAESTRASLDGRTGESHRARKSTGAGPKPASKPAKPAHRDPGAPPAQPPLSIPAERPVEPLSLTEIEKEVRAALRDLRHKRLAGTDRRLSAMLLRLKATAGVAANGRAGDWPQEG